jgi:hypothetical protein
MEQVILLGIYVLDAEEVEHDVFTRFLAGCTNTA